MTKQKQGTWDATEDTTIATTVVTDSQLNNAKDMKVPSWARSIDAIACIVVNVTPTANEPVITKFSLQTNDIPLVPYEVIGPPLLPILGATGDQSGGQAVIYPCDIGVKGGETIKPYCQVMVASTGVIHANVALLYSESAPDDNQKFSKLGTVTSTGTAVGRVNGTAYSISGVSRVVGMLGAIYGTTLAAAKPFTGYIDYVASAFAHTPNKLLMNPVPAVLGALGAPWNIVSFLRCNSKVTGVLNVQDSFVMGIAVTTAGYFWDGLMYETD